MRVFSALTYPLHNTRGCSPLYFTTRVVHSLPETCIKHLNFNAGIRTVVVVLQFKFALCCVISLFTLTVPDLEFCKINLLQI